MKIKTVRNVYLVNYNQMFETSAGYIEVSWRSEERNLVQSPFQQYKTLWVIICGIDDVYEDI